MLRRISIIMLSVAALFLFVTANQPAKADTVYVEYDGPRYASDYYSDRIASEYRRGYQVDDWLERGDSSVTDSPIFEDGIRLAAWASRYEEDFNYAMASAIYFFEIPRNARSIRIKVSYDGEGDRFDYQEDIAGRIWIRRSRAADGHTEFYPDEGRYEDFEKPLYGDTFALRARKNYEIIRVSADDHVIDNMIELHVVAEGGQRIDVKYIEVETYTYLPTVRVVTRYYSDYVWRPWYHYSYWYFYTGPMYHFSDYYYVRYTYPEYHTHYVQIRKRYNNYLAIYYTSRPHHTYIGWAHVTRVPRGTRRAWDRGGLSRWTPNHEQARRTYSTVSVSSTRTRASDVQKARESYRSVLSTRSKVSPAEVRAGTVRSTTTSTTRQGTSVRTDREIETRINRSTETRSRTTVPEARRDTQTRSSYESSSRIQRNTQQDSGSRAPERSSSRTQTQTETRVRRESDRSSGSSSSSAPSQSRSRIEIKRNTTKSENSDEKKSSSSTQQTRIRRESSRSSAPESKTETKKVESRTQSRSQSQSQAPAKVESSKSKDDEDEEEDDEQKKSSSSSRSSSSTRVRRETRR